MKSAVEKRREYARRKRENETPEEKAERLAKNRENQRKRLANETPEQKQYRLLKMRENQKKRLANETLEKKHYRLLKVRENQKRRLANETLDEKKRRLMKVRENQRRRLANETPEEKEYRLSKIRENQKKKLALRAMQEGKFKLSEEWKGESSSQHLLSKNPTYVEDAAPIQGELKLQSSDYPKQFNPDWIIPDSVSNLPHHEINEGEKKGLKSFTSGLYKEGFFTWGDLNAHPTYGHLHNPTATKHSCNLCEFSSPLLEDLNKHLEMHKEKPFKCFHCGYSFAHQRYLLQHEVIHSVKKMYVCEVCKRQFRRECDYKMHIPSHMESPFQCSNLW